MTTTQQKKKKTPLRDGVRKTEEEEETKQSQEGEGVVEELFLDWRVEKEKKTRNPEEEPKGGGLTNQKKMLLGVLLVGDRAQQGADTTEQARLRLASRWSLPSPQLTGHWDTSLQSRPHTQEAQGQLLLLLLFQVYVHLPVVVAADSGQLQRHHRHPADTQAEDNGQFPAHQLPRHTRKTEREKKTKTRNQRRADEKTH